MTTLHDAHSDEELERHLLDSACDDQPSQSTDAAWTQLCAALAQASGESHEARDTLSAEPQPSTTGPDVRANVRKPRALAALRQRAVWLLLGAAGGSLITAAWLAAHDSRAPVASIAGEPSVVVASSERLEPSAKRVMPPQEQPHAEASASADPPTTPDLQNLTTQPQAPAAKVSSPSHAVKAAPPSRREARAALPEASQADNEAAEAISSLAAEVVALDIARSALRAGLAARALRLIEHYHAEFPHSALAPDAEVVALEALDALHNHSQLKARASAFLERYPRDPHESRVLGYLDAERAR